MIWEVRPSMIVNGLYFFKHMEEIWKDINEFENTYQISNYGRVKRKKRNVNLFIQKPGYRTISDRICKLQDNGRGYKQIYVSINKKRKIFYVHRLVAMYFIENNHNKPQVNHKDGNKSNNIFNNLEWCSINENIKHAIENKLINAKGENSKNSKLTEKQVLAIRRLNRINPKFNKTKVAKKLNIRDSTIHKIIKNIRWSHI